MVLPADVRAALEVIESQLALEIFVHTLGAPALFDASNDLLDESASRKTAVLAVAAR
jgi:hypothetical protein